MARGRYPGGGGGLARNTDPETSHLAADRVNKAKLFTEIETLLAHGDRELVSMEISRYLDHHAWSISPRPRQMEEAGILVRTGTRRALGSNNTMTPQTTWRLRREGEPLTGPPPRKKKPCQWLQADDGVWVTKCQGRFTLTDKPEALGMKYCCGCGRPLKDTPPEPRKRRRTKAEMAAAKLRPDELPDWLR